MSHRIRAWGIRRPDGTLAGTAMWGGCVGFNGIALFPTRARARKKLATMKKQFPENYHIRFSSVVPVKGTFEW